MPCPNCDAPLPDPRPRFCPECGQETHVRAPTLGEFVQQFGGAYLSTEGALWRTLVLLLAKPGELTRRYLAGRRKHYVLPLRLYLTVSVIVLLALRLVAGLTIDSDAARQSVQVDEKPTSLQIELGIGRAGLRDGVFYCEGLPTSVCRRLERRLDFDPKRVAAEVGALGERFLASLGPAMFLLLPAFAAGMAAVYRSRRLRYTEHLVFALHVHTFWFAMLGVTLLPLGGAERLAWLAVPVYTLLAMQRVYGGRWWPRLLRAGVVSLLYGMALLVALAFAGLWALLA
jgi:Protein of unknown function (DUF3667)